MDSDTPTMTRCRLFIDEVGNGDLKAASENPNERYLSLTGIITRIDIYEKRFVPEVAQLKSDIFGKDAGDCILHRRELVRREGIFARLGNADLAARFDNNILSLFRSLPYLATTVAIDKQQHLDLYGAWTRDPYHYCLQAIVERFIRWMDRHAYVGDVVIESRGKAPDKRVKETFREIYDHGTENIKPTVVQKRLTSREIKFKSKADNCAAMQIVDLLAHPSFRGMKYERNEKLPDDFGAKVTQILEQWKYARHPKTLIKEGWGKKWLPK